MSARTSRVLFRLGGVAWVALVSAVTIDAHRDVMDDLAIVGRMDESVSEGRFVYERHHCAACHAILGVGARYAPDLTHATERIGDAAIRIRLANGYHDQQVRKMPRKPLEADEIDAIVEYLHWVARIDSREWPSDYPPERVAAALHRAAPLPEQGAVLVAYHGCLDCHSIGDRGNDRAPPLEEIAARDDAAFVGEYLANPARFTHGASMPPFATVPKSQRYAMGTFVASLTR